MKREIKNKPLNSDPNVVHTTLLGGKKVYISWNKNNTVY